MAKQHTFKLDKTRKCLYERTDTTKTSQQRCFNIIYNPTASKSYIAKSIIKIRYIHIIQIDYNSYTLIQNSRFQQKSPWTIHIDGVRSVVCLI